MKSPKLNPFDRAAVEAIADVMMQMNARNDANANQRHEPNADTLSRGTFGHLWSAIVALVFNSTERDIRNVDWNLGGNATRADDIQEAIYAVVERECDEERQHVCDSCPEGNLTFGAVKKALRTRGVVLDRAAGDDYRVSIRGESPALWFISSDLLECFQEGQRKHLCVLTGRKYLTS